LHVPEPECIAKWDLLQFFSHIDRYLPILFSCNRNQGGPWVSTSSPSHKDFVISRTYPN
jgi:hypothetical protein